MAARKKKTTVSKNKTARKSSSAMQLEIQNLLGLLLLVIMTLCIFLHNRMGALGVFMYDVWIGLFGFSAYLLCIYLLVVMVLKIAGVLDKKTVGKWIAVLACILLLSILLHIINGDLKETSIKKIYESASYSNGGAWGGIIGGALVRFMGRTGSLILVIGLFVVAVVIITEKSVIKAVGHLTGNAAREARSKSEEWKLRREEQKLLIEQKKEEARIAAEKEAIARRARLEEARKEAAARLEREKEEQRLRQETVHQKTDNEPEGAAVQEPEEMIEEEITEDIRKEITSVDIPIIDPEQDAYLERKRRFQQRNLQKTQEPDDKKPEQKKEQEQEIIIHTQPEPVRQPKAEIKEVVPEPVMEPEVIREMPVEDETEIMEEPEEMPHKDMEEDALSVDIEEPEVPKDIHVTLAEENDSDRKATTSALPLKNIKGTQLEVEEVYQFPSIELLKPGEPLSGGESREDLMHNARVLEEALMSFGVEAKVLQVNKGPAVTRYELQPEQGVKVSRIVNLADDIALNLAASGIRIEAPIPGKRAVGIEIPNKEAASVYLRDIIESERFQKFPSPLAFSLGKDIDGNVQVADIAKMPHLLIAGATGSGKSVCINSLLISLLYKADPKDVKLILIDPKVVELSVYNGIPHLLIPVVNDPRKAALSLSWAVQEMNKRYKRFADLNVRDIRGYNNAVKEKPELELEPMPKIVIIIDELADLMMVSSKEVEDSICRLAQMARAAGLHLVIATQRPSVDVITGLIKANIPSRIAFAVSSGIDSRTILDTVGAEKLLGRGDMLFSPIGSNKPTRIQGAFVSDEEVERIVNAVKSDPRPNPDLADSINGLDDASVDGEEEELDEYLEQAIQYVVDKQKASISMLQRVFRIGFNRAARLMDSLYERGIVGPDEGSKPRKVLITSEELKSYEDA